MPRLVFSLKEAFQISSDNLTKFTETYILKPLGKTHLISTESANSKKLSLALTFAAIATVGIAYPEQALGFYGFGLAVLSANMPIPRNNRSMYSLACVFFAGQYLTNIENGWAGLISATSGAIRGSLLTAIPDPSEKNDNRFLRASVATAFASASMAAVGVSTYLKQDLSGLMLLPGFAFAAIADFMDDGRGHALRFWKLGALCTVATYDATMAHNYGGALASAFLAQQTIKTAIKSGDFESNGKLLKPMEYLKSLSYKR